jgi:hypothetical protein
MQLTAGDQADDEKYCDSNDCCFIHESVLGCKY